ncbi:FadR family transcriptional regulator [Glutamicibacter sp. MNS18]|uniref:FadR/GntR family transcriptional regulator n=1 Tax=Glutamicibacter sp. MNS18 TaxID=2989817 RepID=UPI002235EDCE|nr:FadR/GntR family transcriptional regulator [Glutamicibacter sp. MNS18]MCW4465401.1 FadR family transcriptional regulator [Glutamicibacter sp. MNS18]
MARKSLVTEVADNLLDRIVDGQLPADSPIPGELELSATLEVSRMTVREAIKTLLAQRIIRVERGRGTYVNPISQWSSLDAVLRATSVGTGAEEAAVQLIELRRMLETGACELAATRISGAELQLLREHLDGMRQAHRDAEVDDFVREDLAFHDVILRASGNAFVPALFEPLRRVLSERRRETSALPDIQQHAIGQHENILRALETGDPARSREAMDQHMQQTLDDLRSYVYAAKDD